MNTFLVFFSYGGKIPVLEFELLRVFCLQMRKVYPHTEVLILTDPATGQILAKAGLKTYEAEVKPETLLLDRTRMFEAYVAAQQVGHLVCMIDYDIIVNRPLGFVDEHDFDVAYTFRRRAKKYPLNGGVVVVRTGEASTHFLRQVLDNYQSLPADQLAWWGDQIGVWNLVAPHVQQLEEGVLNVGNVRLLLMDAETYNWTPFDMDVSPETLRENLFLTESLYQQCKEKAVLHFKGPRKHLQIQYFDRAATDEAQGESLAAPAEVATSGVTGACDLLALGGGRWNVSPADGSEGTFCERAGFREAIAFAARFDVIQFDLRALADGASSRANMEMSALQVGELLDAMGADGRVVPANGEVRLRGLEGMAAILCGVLPLRAVLSGADVRAILSNAPAVSLKALLFALSAAGHFNWRIRSISSSVEPQLPSVLEICAVASLSPFHHVQSFSVRLAASKVYSQYSEAMPWNKRSKAHAAYDLCDWAAFQLVAKEISLKLGVQKKWDFGKDVEQLALLGKYGDFREKLLSGAHYKTHGV